MRRALRQSLSALLLGGALLAVSAPAAGAATFSNATAITIPNGGPATPYPSAITVAGLGGTVTDVNVTLANYGHQQPEDVGVVVVAPGGQALELMDAVGDAMDVTGLNFAFDDSASMHLPSTDPLVSGSYKPTNHINPPSTFPPPGPGTAYSNPGPAAGGTATFASTFNGATPNGTWNLYVVDFFNVADTGGSIAGGWALEVSSTGAPPALLAPAPVGTPRAKKCKKKKKKRTATASKRCKRKRKK